MATGYKVPVPIVEWCPGTAVIGGTQYSPLNYPGDGVWTALTIGSPAKSRILAFENKRGRNDKVDRFEAGTATFLLDNTDGQLDELKAGSLTEGNKGGALTPIRFRLTNPATGTTSTIWTGFITDGWEPSSPTSRVRTVTVRAVDYMGWAATRAIPKSLVAALIADEGPVVWMRGDISLTRISSAAGIAYDSGSLALATCSPIGTEYAEATDSLATGDDDLAMRLMTGCRISTNVNVTAATLATFICLFQVTDTATYGRDIAVGRTLGNAGNRRWRVRIGTNGHLAAELDDAAGANIGTATMTIPHNDGQPHIVMVQFNAGPVVDMVSDLGAASSGVIGTFAGRGGWLLTGSAVTDVRVLVDEWAYFDKTVAFPYDLSAVLDGTYVGLWTTDSIASRLARLGTLANVTIPGSFFVPAFAAGATAVGAYVPQDTFGAAIVAAAGALAGSAFAVRGKGVQVYGYGDLSNAWFTAAKANFSNQVIPSGTVVRYEGSGRTGRLLSRVINRVNARGAILAKNQTSIDTYGVQELEIDSRNTAVIAGYAATIVSERKDPTGELGELTIRPWGDQTATTWLLESCELGRKSDYVEMTPDGTATAYSATLAIQSESWSWSDGTDWTVTLKLA